LSQPSACCSSAAPASDSAFHLGLQLILQKRQPLKIKLPEHLPQEISFLTVTVLLNLLEFVYFAQLHLHCFSLKFIPLIVQ
jgi:hypothetical protein